MGVLLADRVSLVYRSAGVRAVDGVTVYVRPGGAIGVAGESGSGKSSLARMLVGMLAPTSGSVTWDGTPLTALPSRGPGGRSRAVQMILQDPSSSLNPRMTAGETIQEALRENWMPGDPRQEMLRLLDAVGLDGSDAAKYPFQFSGGQRQRVSIARALAVAPEVLVCDEITSALDVSVQASILNLLRELRERTGVALVFVSHNLDVIRFLCDEVLVMRGGAVVEAGPVDQVFEDPRDPYTRQLLAAIPRLGASRTSGPRTGGGAQA